MQTFIPCLTFPECASVLDRQRLGKQRMEVLQLLRALRGVSSGWVTHPATRMWQGHEYSLAEYGLAVCAEWISRGYKDTCTAKIKDLQGRGDPSRPLWWGNPRVHSSHRASLLFKNSEHYSRFGWGEVPQINYIWPV
jgi:hypothetical protein